MVDFINRRHGILTAALFIGFLSAGFFRGNQSTTIAVILAVCALGVLWALAVDGQATKQVKIAQGDAQPSESARLIADCEFQHAAWQRGDWETALYGRFHPSGLDPETRRIYPEISKTFDSILEVFVGSPQPSPIQQLMDMYR